MHTEPNKREDDDDGEHEDMVNTYHNELLNDKLYDNSRSRHSRHPGQLSQREKRKRTLDIENDNGISRNGDHLKKPKKQSRLSKSPKRESDNDMDYRDIHDRQSQESSFQQYQLASNARQGEENKSYDLQDNTADNSLLNEKFEQYQNDLDNVQEAYAEKPTGGVQMQYR